MVGIRLRIQLDPFMNLVTLSVDILDSALPYDLPVNW